MIVSSFVLALVFSTRITMAALAMFSDVISYELTPEEVEALIHLRRSHKPSSERSQLSQHFQSATNMIFGESKQPKVGVTDPYHYVGKIYPHQGSTLADCPYHDGIREPRKIYSFRFHEAECENPGTSPMYNVSCKSRHRFSRLSDPTWGGPIWQFIHICPKKTVCVDVAAAPNMPVPRNRDIVCRPEKEVESLNHAAVALKGAGSSASSEIDWCSLETLVPGLDHSSSSVMTSFVLSEEVLWANRSHYNAPKLWIQDSPKGYTRGFDLGWSTNTNLLSTEINVPSYRGRLQPRAVNFCMELIRGGNVWTIMIYTYFRYDHRRHKVIPRRLYNTKVFEED